MKEKILITARQLFRKRGLRDVNVNEICHELGISKKTFYQYYSTKEGLVGSIIEEDLKNVQEDFKKKTEGKEVVDLLVYISEMSSKNIFAQQRKLDAEIQKFYPDTFKAQADKKRELLRGELSDFYTRGVEEGVFRPDIDYESTIFMLIFMHKSMKEYLFGEFDLPGRKKSSRTLACTFKDIVLHIFLTPLGWQKFEEKTKNNNS